MNILYVTTQSTHINTSSSLRNISMIEGFLENGHNVTCITFKPDKYCQSYDSYEIKHPNYQLIELNIHNSDLLNSKVKTKVKSKKVIYYLYKLRNFFRVYDKYKNFVDKVELPNLNNVDLLISSSDPKSSHLLGEKIFSKLSPVVTWIQIWGDPFLSDITSKKINMRKIKKEESRLLSKANKIVYVSELTLKSQQKKYIFLKEKMYYFPIPFKNIREFEVEDLKKKKKVNLSYCGDFNSNVRNIIPLYNCNSENVNINIYGNSNLNLKSINNVLVHRRVDLKKVAEIEEKSDILVHLSNLNGNQIPGKIYQYFGTNKPILFILDGDIKGLLDIFHKYNRCYFCNNNTDDITKTIKDIIAGNRFIENKVLYSFSKKYITGRMLEILND